MPDFSMHFVAPSDSIKYALEKIDKLGKFGTLFVVDAQQRLVGTLTDGDIRRGLIKGLKTSSLVSECMNRSPVSIEADTSCVEQIVSLRTSGISLIPVVSKLLEVIDVVNLHEQRSLLPIDAVIMAGGRGIRLRPLTEKIPKPLLMVGEKPIMKHNLDRLMTFGIKNYWVSVNYLGEKIIDYFGNGRKENISIKYLHEPLPLGTIGSASLVENFINEDVLVTNSDLLTKVDYEKFYLDFKSQNADMSVLSIPYEQNIPFAVMDTADSKVLSFIEKPTYTHFTNGGVYLIKRHLLEGLKENQYFDATDLMQKVIDNGQKLIHFPSQEYWLDIGSHSDYLRAQQDIQNLDL
jgi:dTDP-glucose pyrophosphorylase